MISRLTAIVLIFCGTTVAWSILGATVYSRTYGRSKELGEKLESNWGGKHFQRPPSVWSGPGALTPESTRLNVKLNLEPRQKGLLWFNTYNVAVEGKWHYRGTPGADLQIRLPLPAQNAVYDGLQYLLNGREAVVLPEKDGAHLSAHLADDGMLDLTVRYRTRGMEEWSYQFGDGTLLARDFELHARTDFDGIDFPEGGLSPTKKAGLKEGGLDLLWSYQSLVTGQSIRIGMPHRLQPGPLAADISYFAPVSLLFYFFVLYMLAARNRVPLHAMHYFFLACAFFAFHLLFAYTVDHMPVVAAFVLASLVSIGLSVSYLRLAAGMDFAVRYAGVAQLVYLVLFSSAFFFAGFTGLAVTIGAILTLFLMMQLTGRLQWGGVSDEGAT